MNDREVIARLLPAEAADAGCRVAFELLDRYVEAELATHDAGDRYPGVAAHLRGCAACHEVYVGLVALVVDPD